MANPAIAGSHGIMKKFVAISFMLALAPLAACQERGSTQSEEQKSVAEIENRADQISAAADAAINQQIADINEAANSADVAVANVSK